MSKLTQEQLERLIANINNKCEVLEEEYWQVKQEILSKGLNDREIVELIERLRDNLKTREELASELRNAYKDSLDLQNDWR